MQTIDPITLEVIRGFLVSTVFQMRATLIRTSYAPVLYESHDFSCGLLNTKGELVAMSEDFSGHVFAMRLGLGAVQEKFKDDIHPGDVLPSTTRTPAALTSTTSPSTRLFTWMAGRLCT